MSETVPIDSVRFHRPPLFPGIELVSVCYLERSFPEHSHDEFVVGAVIDGAETLSVSGSDYRVDTGSALQLHPEEAHSNTTIGGRPLRYHVLYMSGDIVRESLRCDSLARLRFPIPTSTDAALFAAIIAAHTVMSVDTNGRLEQECALHRLTHALACQTPVADALVPYQRLPRQRIAEVKAYIDEHFADNFGLHDLAALSGLSPFHFARSFKQAVGLSPLAYRNQRRIAQTRLRLLDGQPIAQVALDMGYADQSHLTRQFQRIVGASPRRYAQQ